MATTGSSLNSLFLSLWQTNGFDNDVVVVLLNFFRMFTVVDRLEAKVLPVVFQLSFIRTSKCNLVNTTRLQDLGNQLTFEAISNDNSILVWVSFEQVNPVFSTGDWFDYGSRFQGNVVWDVVNNFFRSGKVFFKTTITGNTDSIEVLTQFWTG